MAEPSCCKYDLVQHVWLFTTCPPRNPPIRGAVHSYFEAQPKEMWPRTPRGASERELPFAPASLMQAWPQQPHLGKYVFLLAPAINIHQNICTGTRLSAQINRFSLLRRTACGSSKYIRLPPSNPAFSLHSFPKNPLCGNLGVIGASTFRCVGASCELSPRIFRQLTITSRSIGSIAASSKTPAS